jgi:xylan 1,4-beta-xylosidase
MKLKFKTLLKNLCFVILMGLLLTQMVFGAWQSDNGNGTFQNPILYADYPDPSMIRVGNDFYMASSTFVNSPGLVILHSQDLVNWEIISHCIPSLPSGGAYDMIGGVKYCGGCFAPSLAYYNGTFYVAVDLNGDGGTRIYRATNPAGPWTLNQLSTGYFDPCLFFDNGTPYLVWGGAWENSMKIIQLNSTLTGTVGSQSTILTYNNIEGAHLVKRGSYYYLFNAVPANSLVCSRSTSLKGPYSGTTTVCRAGSGGHQGGIVDLADGSWWGYLHQDDGGIGRMTRICPITWSNDWPLFGRSGYTGTVESSYTKPIAGKPVMVPATSDEFNGNSLGLQWMWNHNPDNSKWSFTGSALRLRATTGADFWRARNSLTQKTQGLTSTGTIRIDCSAMQPGDIMGLGIMGSPRGYIAVTRDPKRIIMSQDDSVRATVSNISANILYFRVETNFSTKQAKFFWRDDSTTTWQQVGTTITMSFSISGYGTFQGEQYAILCFNPGSSSGYMDVDWFRLDDKPGPGGNSTPTPTPNQGPTPTPTPTSGSRSAYSQIEAESFNTQSGIQTESCGEGGQNIGYIENGDYVVYNNIDFASGATGFQARVASATSGGNIEIRLDSTSGPLVGTCAVAGTGGWQTWVTNTCTVSGASGTHNLYLRFTGGSGYLMNLNWIKFTSGIVNTPTPSSTATPTRIVNTPTPTPPGSYVKFRNVATGLYIDGMGSTSNGANACQYSSSTSNNQQWTMEAAGSYYKIKNRATGLYLDGMGRTSNGSICGQWSGSSSNNQQWTQETAGSNVKYKNRATGLYLDGMGSTGNGSNLCQWSSSSSTNQQWQKQ